jgi:hypothetical protein
MGTARILRDVLRKPTNRKRPDWPSRKRGLEMNQPARFLSVLAAFGLMTTAASADVIKVGVIWYLCGVFYLFC